MRCAAAVSKAVMRPVAYVKSSTITSTPATQLCTSETFGWWFALSASSAMLATKATASG